MTAYYARLFASDLQDAHRRHSPIDALAPVLKLPRQRVVSEILIRTPSSKKRRCSAHSNDDSGGAKGTVAWMSPSKLQTLAVDEEMQR
jgi:hypothetical protein